MIETITASSLIVLRNFFGIAVYPYKTMRRVSQERDILQLVLIGILIYFYFVIANIIRQKTLHPFIISSSSFLSFIFFLITFSLAVSFFALLGKTRDKKFSPSPLIFSFAYSLLPTLIWFFATSLLFFILPPPRTASILGQGFSLVFVVFSLTLLVWRMILLYLSVRFSLKTDFYQTLFYIVLFLVWFLPYSYFMYYFGIFRIPFI